MLVQMLSTWQALNDLLQRALQPVPGGAGAVSFQVSLCWAPLFFFLRPPRNCTGRRLSARMQGRVSGIGRGSLNSDARREFQPPMPGSRPQVPLSLLVKMWLAFLNSASSRVGGARPGEAPLTENVEAARQKTTQQLVESEMAKAAVSVPPATAGAAPRTEPAAAGFRVGASASAAAAAAAAQGPVKGGQLMSLT